MSIVYLITKNDFEDIVCADSMFSTTENGQSQGYSQLNKIKKLHPFDLIPAESMFLLMDKLQEKGMQ